MGERWSALFGVVGAGHNFCCEACRLPLAGYAARSGVVDDRDLPAKFFAEAPVGDMNPDLSSHGAKQANALLVEDTQYQSPAVGCCSSEVSAAEGV
jgi:hypothetical protein